MKYRFIIITILLILCWNLAGEQLIIRFNNPDTSIITTFNNSNYDVASYVPGKYLDIVVSEDVYNELLSNGYSPIIFRTETQMLQNLRGDRLNGYSDYEDVLAELQQLEILYPEICKLYDIGETWGKIYSDAGISTYDNYYHEVWALKISDNVEIEEDEPNIYYMATHHAREPISTETSLKIMNHLIDNYGSDDEITANVNSSQIWIIPLVNPNGHKLVTDEDFTMWRKNIRDNNLNNTIDASYYDSTDGVDPNRNYGFEWGLVGASDDFTSYTYHGPEAFSEPENQAIKDLLESHNFIAGISYHSYSELVLYPFGYCEGVSAPDNAELALLANQMAATIPSQSGGNYIPSAAWELYACQGTSDDYFYGVHGVFAYTVELAQEFIPPANQVDLIAGNNIEAAMILLNRMNGKMLTGHITDATTGAPIEAQITIDTIDDLGVYREPYQSDANFGSYYRFLPANLYSVTYTAYGYDTVTIDDVLIYDTEITILDVPLVPCATNFPIVGIIMDGISGDAISNAKIVIDNLDCDPVYSNSDGTFVFPSQYAYGMEFTACAQNYAAAHYSFEIDEDNNSPQILLYAIQNDGFESGEIAESWNQSGDMHWIITSSTSYDGTYAIKSGAIYHNQSTTISVGYDVAEDDQISFACKASTEYTYDFLYFRIDGTTIDSWSGEQNWIEVSYPVTAGYHTFSWSYVKDNAIIGGSDETWVDAIVFPNSASFDFNPPQNFVVNHTYDCPDNHYYLSWDMPQTSASELIGFNVYTGYQLSAQVGADVTSINDPEIYGDYALIPFYVTAVYQDPEGESAPTEIIEIDPALDAEENSVSAVTFLIGNYPNPFNPSTTIEFSLKETGKVKLSIFNVKGQKVRTLSNMVMDSGNHKLIWNGKDDDGNSVTSGIYFSRLEAGRQSFSRKMILLK